MSQLLERDPTGPLGATPILVERAFSTESGGSRSTLARVSVGAVSSSRCAPVCASERHAQEVSSGCARRRGSGSLASLELIVEIHQQVARQRGGDVDSELVELADDPHVAPGGVLARQPEDPRTGLSTSSLPGLACGYVRCLA